MERNEMCLELKEKKEIEYYIEKVYKDHSLIPLLLGIMETDKTAVKFQAEKVIRRISEERPELIYPYFARLISLLDSKNSFIRLGLILTVPNLLRVDKENEWVNSREKYLSFLHTRQIAEFGNIVSGIKKILEVHPEEEKVIIPVLLNVDKHIFIYHDEISPECLNVAKGHIIDCFTELYPESNFKEEMVSFIEDNKENTRKQVRVKADRFLKKYLKLSKELQQ